MKHRVSAENASGSQVVNSRRGVALTELAVCLPLLMLLTFGGIETADMVFLKETLKSVSYEGARASAKFNSNNDEVLARMNSIITGSQIDGASISVELPNDKTNVNQLDKGEIVTIRVSAPADANTVGPLKMFAGLTIEATTLMVRE
jgi:Flp pilus assembly protein TadG